MVGVGTMEEGLRGIEKKKMISAEEKRHHAT